MVNEKEAPEGYKAVEFDSCHQCAFDKNHIKCSENRCTAEKRKDGHSIQFVKLEKEETELPVAKAKLKIKTGYPKFMEGHHLENPDGSNAGYSGIVCFISETVGFALTGDDKDIGVQDMWVPHTNMVFWKPYVGKLKLSIK